MGYWEFLLQKEGDQSWLPLDASQVEILEGRYRVMAHTSHTNTPVQIQIGQVLAEGQRPGPDRRLPRRRTLRRQGQTNANGLMVVMPFTHLGEGSWDIRCARAIASDSPPVGVALGSSAGAEMPPDWCYAVQLQVVGQDAAAEGDWFADEGSAASTPAAVETATAPALDLQAAAIAMDAFHTRMATDPGTDPWPYGLALPHTALLGGEGESLELTATVSGPAEEPQNAQLSLVVRLTDPQTAATVALAAAALATPALPASVTLAVTVPTRLSTRLLLGEVGLLSGVEVVAVQRFTVTVDVASLFDAIANQAETEADLNVVFPADGPEADGPKAKAPEEGAASPPALDLKTWDIAGRAAPPREMPILTLPRSSPELPPKIYYPSPHEAAARQPSLPPMGRSRPAPRADGSPESESPVPAAPSPEPVRGLSLPPIASPPRLEDPAAALTGQSPVRAGGPPRGPAPQLISHEAMGFKDLKLQDRFWNRLNELAVTLQQEAIEQRTEVAAPPLPEGVDDPVEPPPFVPFAGEVVIYADEDPTLGDLERLSTAGADSETESPAAVVTPPMPSLELPEGDLTAGEPVVVTLRVPFHANRLYLKVWITDPQTRTLADEPRQVLNLLPNGRGQMEGSVQLTAPLGCLEAWFEAISVDMVTQQESYKASVSRAIAPAGLSSTSLDEFQI
ncbi:hypothetical protein PGN35_010930 [Nodosilinea sp. PGN35]|uniref:hypothetical protein n=1 Tax=Nodosilinea sp. PGN35 TaxID=3020489 RepID=UPI0023B2323E|nr:hypothetical protein [Nodosilinea sp. TSF1-S3]MDF0366455.1 hypothetical protein [Nodosilinea sp. TSF1-S3]